MPTKHMNIWNVMISQVISTHRNQTPCVFFLFFPRNVAGTPNRIPDLHQIEECQHQVFSMILLMEEVLQQLIGRLFHYLQASFHPRWLAGFLLWSREFTIHFGFIMCHRSFFSPSSASARKVIIIVLSCRQSSNHPILKSKHQDQGPLANKNSMRSDHVFFSVEPWLLWFLVSASTHLCLCHLGNLESLNNEFSSPWKRFFVWKRRIFFDIEESYHVSITQFFILAIKFISPNQCTK